MPFSRFLRITGLISLLAAGRAWSMPAGAPTDQGPQVHRGLHKSLYMPRRDPTAPPPPDAPIRRGELDAAVNRLMDRIQDIEARPDPSTEDLANVEELSLKLSDDVEGLREELAATREELARLRDETSLTITKNRRRMPGGIQGLIAFRAVLTDDNGPAGSVGGTLGPDGTPSGTVAPMSRYSGDFNAPNFQNRMFVTVPQLSLSLDRLYEEGIGVHVQVDLDADAADNKNFAAAALPVDLPGGSGALQINEAYIDLHDLLDGVAARMGAWALPVSREHNGSHRTLDYTITPSAVSWRLETYRPIGLELRNEDPDVDVDWRAGFFAGLEGPGPGGGLPVDPTYNGMLFPSHVVRNMLGFPITLANIPYTDVPYGVAGTGVTGTLAQAIGAYGRASSMPDSPFSWDVNLLFNGASADPDDTERMPATQFAWLVASASHTWRYFDVIGQLYMGRTDLITPPLGFALPTEEPVNSLGGYVLLCYRFDPESHFTFRLEGGTDEVEALGDLNVHTITLAYNRIINDHSMIQVEAVLPDVTYAAERDPGAMLDTVPTNDVDPRDDLIQVNYKFRF